MGDVVQVEQVQQEYRNLNFLRVRVRIDPAQPLLMGVYILLDNHRTIWVQFRYERIFRICHKCGCLGHIVRDCRKNQGQVQAAIDEQKRNIRHHFNVQSFCDVGSVLFTPVAIAFHGRNHCRTTRVYFRRRNQDESNYDMYDHHPPMFRRPRSPSHSPAPPLNIIQAPLPEDSTSDSEAARDQEEAPIDILDEDPEPPVGYYDNDSPMEIDTAAMQIHPHIPHTSFTSNVGGNSSSDHVSNGVIFSTYSELNQVVETAMAPSTTVTNDEISPQADAPIFTQNLAVNNANNVTDTVGPPLPLVLIWNYLQNMETATWDSLINHLLQNGPPSQAQCALSTLSHGQFIRAASSFQQWVQLFLPPDTGFGLVIHRSANCFTWAMFPTAFSNRPNFLLRNNSLLFFPTHTGPFLYTALNWFFSITWAAARCHSWMLNHRVNPHPLFRLHQPFSTTHHPHPSSSSKRRLPPSIAIYPIKKRRLLSHAATSRKRRGQVISLDFPYFIRPPKLHKISCLLSPSSHNLQGSQAAVPNQPLTQP